MSRTVLVAKCDARRTRRATRVLFSAWIVATLTVAAIGRSDPPQGTVVAWGRNDLGQTNVPAPNTGFIAVAAGINHSLGLRTGGSIVAWGYGCQTHIPTYNNANFIAIATGAYHSLALKAGGRIWAWGCSSSYYGPCFFNNFGQCDVPKTDVEIIAVAAGQYHSLGLKTDGTIVAWGCDSYWHNYGQCEVPLPNADIIAVAAGGGPNLGLKVDGSIVAWSAGYTYNPAPGADFVAIAAGWYHSLGLKSDGSIVAWGDNELGQTDVPAPNTGFVAIAAGGAHSLGLKDDGSIVAWGRNSDGQTNVPTPNSDFVAIAAGWGHSLAIRRIGACCDLLSGTCAEDVGASACSGAQQTWTGGAACVDVVCEAVTGACCDHDPFGACTDGVTRAACDCPTCEWLKLGSCSELDCPHTTIPTVGEWGLLVLALLLLTGAKLAFRRANPADASGP